MAEQHVPHSAAVHPRRWALRMTWDNLLFMHWPVPASSLAPLLPPGLTLDTFDGQAWLGVVPFSMSNVRMHWAPPLFANQFHELNVRTYVTCRGTPGVWFFSLDATSRLAVRAARAGFHLPYFDADIHVHEERDGAIRYASRRTHEGAPPSRLAVTYAPTGSPYHSDEGSLERFLTDRLTLYAADNEGTILRGDIQHAPWPLQPARATITDCMMSEQIGVRLPNRAPLLHFAKRLDVQAWWRIPVLDPSVIPS